MKLSEFTQLRVEQVKKANRLEKLSVALLNFWYPHPTVEGELG